MEDKIIIRNSMLEKLKSFTKAEYEQLSTEIRHHLISSEAWLQANTIGITISRMPEVDTYRIIKIAWEEGKEIVVPKCNPKDKSMVFRTLTNFDELESIYYHLFEPIESITKEKKKSEIDLMIVPGVVYHPTGYRIGFGGGYYDRYLADYKGQTVSLAFETQLVDDIPKEAHDIPVAMIITEKGVQHIHA